MHTLVYTIPVMEDSIANYAVNSVRSNYSEKPNKSPLQNESNC